MQLSQKQKTLSQFFAAFLKSNLKFEHWEEKDDPHGWCMCQIKDSKKGG